MTEGPANEVRITSDVHALVEHLNGEVEAIVRDVLDAHVQQVFADAKAAWPVDTGFSLTQFHLERFGEGWRFRNDAHYSNLIGDGDVAHRLIIQPLNDGMVQVAELIAERVSRIGA